MTVTGIVALLDVEMLKKTWRGLVDYRSENRRKLQKKSGASGGTCCAKWVFEDNMSFLDTVCPLRQ